MILIKLHHFRAVLSMVHSGFLITITIVEENTVTLVTTQGVQASVRVTCSLFRFSNSVEQHTFVHIIGLCFNIPIAD